MAKSARNAVPPSRTLWLGDDLRTRVERYERRLIVAALARNGGNQTRAAESLGVLPTTLNEKMKRLDIPSKPGARRHARPDPEERERLAAALAESAGHEARAAAALHMSPRCLREKLRIHRLEAIREPLPPRTPAFALEAALESAFAGLRRVLQNAPPDEYPAAEPSGASPAVHSPVPRHS